MIISTDLQSFEVPFCLCNIRYYLRM